VEYKETVKRDDLFKEKNRKKHYFHRIVKRLEEITDAADPDEKNSKTKYDRIANVKPCHEIQMDPTAKVATEQEELAFRNHSVCPDCGMGLLRLQPEQIRAFKIKTDAPNRLGLVSLIEDLGYSGSLDWKGLRRSQEERIPRMFTYAQFMLHPLTPCDIYSKQATPSRPKIDATALFEASHFGEYFTAKLLANSIIGKKALGSSKDAEDLVPGRKAIKLFRTSWRNLLFTACETQAEGLRNLVPEPAIWTFQDLAEKEKYKAKDTNGTSTNSTSSAFCCLFSRCCCCQSHGYSADHIRPEDLVPDRKNGKLKSKRYKYTAAEISKVQSDKILSESSCVLL